jgi:molybdopterin/thiamine biosynthesis adenylyltransferase
VGHICINDFDSIDETNLPRQILYRDADIGKAKVSVAAERLNEINPEITVTPIETKLDKDSLREHVAASDVVLDCTDNFQSRWLINELCAQQQTALVSGAAIRWEGQVSVFRHDRGTAPCYQCLYQEEDENLNNCAGQGILAPVAGTIGCMMATETIKVLQNMASELQGQVWVYDAASGSSHLLKITPNPDCPVCGQS